MDNLHENSPSEYSKLVKALSDDGSVTEHQCDAYQFYQHYKDINSNKPELNGFQKELQSKLITFQSVPSFSELDFTISDGEILKAITHLKDNEGSGFEKLALTSYWAHWTNFLI